MSPTKSSHRAIFPVEGSAATRAARNPRIGPLVGLAIAGISLIDAVFLALTAHLVAATVAVGAFLLTRLLQRRIAGT